MKAPAWLVSDYCLRCMKVFRDGDHCAIVSPASQDHEVGINVCHDCLTVGNDLVHAISIYMRAPGPLPLDDAERMKPIFSSDRPMEGFVKLGLLETGLWRVGFQNGHAEIWTASEIEKWQPPASLTLRVNQEFRDRLVQNAPTRPARSTTFAYSRDYGLYGPIELMGEGAHPVVRTEFLDLRIFRPTRMPNAN